MEDIPVKLMIGNTEISGYVDQVRVLRSNVVGFDIVFETLYKKGCYHKRDTTELSINTQLTPDLKEVIGLKK